MIGLRSTDLDRVEGVGRITIERRLVALVGMVEDLGDRLEGRMENASRTASLHPDPEARRAAAVRELAYKTALADLYAMLENVR